jgi:hypothetical protein
MGLLLKTFMMAMSWTSTFWFRTMKPSLLAFFMAFENIQEFFMPIELNLRSGGGETWSMNLAAYGVNTEAENIDLMFGIELERQELDYKHKNPQHSCISAIFIEREICAFDKARIEARKKPSCQLPFHGLIELSTQQLHDFVFVFVHVAGHIRICRDCWANDLAFCQKHF